MAHVTQFLDQAKAWVMPKPNLGTPVLWYVDADTNQTAHYGNVVEVNANTVSIKIMMKDGFLMKYDVCHKSDPMLKLSSDRRTSGCWELTPEMQRLQSMEKEIGVMRDAIESIREQIKDLPVMESYPPPVEDRWNAEGTTKRKPGRQKREVEETVEG